MIPGSGRSPGVGNGNPLQYSCLGNPMDGGAWWATVHGVTQSWTWLSMHTHTVANLTGFPDHSESTLGPLWHLWEPLNSGKRPFVFLTDWVCCLSIFLIHLCRPAPCVLSHSVVSGSLRPMGCSPSGSSIHGISQARILEWVAIPFSRGSFRLRDQTQVSRFVSRFFTI